METERAAIYWQKLCFFMSSCRALLRLPLIFLAAVVFSIFKFYLGIGSGLSMKTGGFFIRIKKLGK